MFDKITVSDKVILDSIPQSIQEIGSKGEVFDKLKEQIPEYQHESLAKRIVAFISDETKKQNKGYVYFIVFILFSYLVFSTINFVMNYKYSANKSLLIISFSILCTIYLLFFYGFLRFKLFAFTTAVSLYSISFVAGLYEIIFKPTSQAFLITLFNLLTLFYFYFVRKRLFPEITFWGNIKKDKNKKYIFST